MHDLASRVRVYARLTAYSTQGRTVANVGGMPMRVATIVKVLKWTYICTSEIIGIAGVPDVNAG